MLRATYLAALTAATATPAIAQGDPPGWELRSPHVWQATVDDPEDRGHRLLGRFNRDSASAHAQGSTASAHARDVVNFSGVSSSASASGAGQWWYDSATGVAIDVVAQLNGVASASIHLIHDPCRARCRTYTALMVGQLTPDEGSESGVVVHARIGGTTEDEWVEGGETVRIPGFAISFGGFSFELPDPLTVRTGMDEVVAQAEPPDARLSDNARLTGNVDAFTIISETRSEAMAYANGYVFPWPVIYFPTDESEASSVADSNVVVLINSTAVNLPEDGGVPVH